MNTQILTPLFVLGLASACFAQLEAKTNTRTSTRQNTPVYRTIVTYNGAVCIATPNYDLMPDGRFIFKSQGMRFDSASYFWSPAIHDNVVRRSHYDGRILGQTSQYWPPLATTTQPRVSTPTKRQTLKPNKNPYFGSGSQKATRNTKPNIRSTNQKQLPQLMRCPNGSYAVICQ